VHKEFITGQSLGFLHLYARAHRGHGHPIEQGAQS
jgi:hypothetical protein